MYFECMMICAERFTIPYDLLCGVYKKGYLLASEKIKRSRCGNVTFLWPNKKVTKEVGQRGATSKCIHYGRIATGNPWYL